MGGDTGGWYPGSYVPPSRGFVELVRGQLPEQAREAFHIKLRTDAFGIVILAKFMTVRTGVEHEFPVGRDLLIPPRDLAYLMVLAG